MHNEPVWSSLGTGQARAGDVWARIDPDARRGYDRTSLERVLSAAVDDVVKGR